MIKSKISKEFNEQAEELNKIFKGYRNWNPRIEKALTKLGYICIRGKHIRLYKNGKFVSTIASTSSDGMTGNQVIRNIRAFYERELMNGR